MSGMFGGNTPTPQLNTFSYPGMPQAASTTMSDISGLGNFNIGAGFAPQVANFAGSTAGAVGGPQGQFAQNIAGQAAPMLAGAGLGNIGTGGLFGNAAAGMIPAVGQLLGNAFDPQNALYGRTLSQVQNQTGANLANTGVGGTPYGANVMGNTLGNFNIDWQNSQLQREIAGAQGAGGLLGSAAGTALQGAGLEGQGGNLATMGGMLPFNTLAGLNQAGMGALGGAAQFGNQISQIPQTAISDWLNYLSGGTQSQNVSNQAQMDMAKFTAQQQQQQYENIASAIGGVASIAGELPWGSMGGGLGPLSFIGMSNPGSFGWG